MGKNQWCASCDNRLVLYRSLVQADKRAALELLARLNSKANDWFQRSLRPWASRNAIFAPPSTAMASSSLQSGHKRLDVIVRFVVHLAVFNADLNDISDAVAVHLSCELRDIVSPATAHRD
jgi:hypothetical protein